MFRGSRTLTSLGRLAAVGGTVLILSSLFLSVGAAAVSAADTGAKAPGGTVGPNDWTDASNAFADDGAVATASGDNVDQGFTTFGFGIPAGSIIDGITVRVEAASTDATGCQVQVRLSDNDGSSFTARQSAALTDAAQVFTLGGAADDWGNVWDPTQTTNGTFRLELRNNSGGGCAADAVTSVDFIDAQVTYRNIANGTTNPPVSSEVCDSADFNFVIDMSGSIGPQGSSPSNLPALKAGINDFVDAFQAAGGNGRYSGTRFNGTSASTITSGYETADDFKAAVTALSGPAGTTPTASGITTAAGNIANGRAGVQNIMFVITDGSPNVPNSHGNDLSVPETWLEGANAAINAADAVRGTGSSKFHIKAVYLSAPGDPGDISLPFSSAGDSDWASAVMTEIGGGSFLEANFSSFADELFPLIACPPPTPADIAIVKTADDASVEAGNPIGFTISVTNEGGVDATGVALTDSLPAGGDLDWSIESQTGISGCTISGAVGSQSIDCPTVTLAPAASYSIHIVSDTSPASADSVHNVASVTTTNDGSDEDDADVVILKAGIDIVKVADIDHVDAGADIGFTITVSSTGAATARGVTLTDALPDGGDLVWALDSQTGIAGCSIAGAAGSQTIDCPAVDLAPAAGYSLHISATTSLATDDTVTNNASVTTTNDGSDEDGDTITINKSAIAIVKTADDPEVEAGDTIGFTVTVTNNGAATATGVVVNDPLPNDPGLDWTLDDDAGGLCSLAANTVTCGPTTLEPGASFSFHISSPTTDETAETSPVLNVATVTTTNAGSDEDDADVIVEGGEVEQATGTPKPTLPPTDASGSVSGPGTSILLVLVGLAVLTLGVGVLTPVPASIRRRRDQ
jgi:uncharacterized repeat protein (TIGR01451 family)